MGLSHIANAQPSSSIYTSWETGFTKGLAATHDMALPAWGPYSNKYNGISHVPPQNDGMRFDVMVQPSLYLRNQTQLANVQRETGYHPWEATPDLSYFSYRYELEWKDKVYCDVSFSTVDEQSRLIRAEFVNNTDHHRSLALNLFSAINFPYVKKMKVLLPSAVAWLPAANYNDFVYGTITPDYNLVYNGQLRGQISDSDAVSGTAIRFGKNKNDRLEYVFNTDLVSNNAVLIIRYRTNTTEAVQVDIGLNNTFLRTLTFPGSAGYRTQEVILGKIQAGKLSVSFLSKGTNIMRLDGFALVEKEQVADVQFREDSLQFAPEEIATDVPNSFLLKFKAVQGYYGLVWADAKADKREVLDDNADVVLSVFNNLVKSEGGNSEPLTVSGNGKGWFGNVFSAPILLKPKQKAIRYCYVVYGNTVEEATKKLIAYNKQWEGAEAAYKRQQAKAVQSNINKAGTPYRFSQQLMQATTLTNLLYPTFTANKFIKHTTPGKRWSSLYTWDAGFIALGYASLNRGRALESLNAYTMSATEQSAFLEHGTPLPTQGYVFNELWNQTQNSEYLTYFYPRLKRFYDFLGGSESSPTRKLHSNLLATWDIFYNSGGWDDYPPQVHIHKEGLEPLVAPAVNTSHQIRFAKLLKMAARQLGNAEDVKKYDADINVYTTALQKYSWDEASGYFGYVLHDKNGEPTTILKHATGKNFNRGLDGVSPLIAGICDADQQAKLLGHLFSRQELWTDQGITAVDQSAPYYNKEGYWNGRVWMPHQWFLWKTLLDLNEPQKAVQIAKTALDVWKRETEDSYNCWENFSIETGNGGGWHQFGALSSPVLNWFASLYKAGTVTHGFNLWPVAQKFSPNNDSFEGTYRLFPDGNQTSCTLLFCLNDTFSYRAHSGNKTLPMIRLLEGLYAIKVDAGTAVEKEFKLTISKK